MVLGDRLEPVGVRDSQFFQQIDGLLRMSANFDPLTLFHGGVLCRHLPLQFENAHVHGERSLDQRKHALHGPAQAAGQQNAEHGSVYGMGVAVVKVMRIFLSDGAVNRNVDVAFQQVKNMSRKGVQLSNKVRVAVWLGHQVSQRF